MVRVRTTRRFKPSSAIGSRTPADTLSYTWGHSIDSVSSDGNFTNVPPGASPSSDRGSSIYDILQTFSGAVSYNIPAPGHGIWNAIFGDWSTDSIIYARTAPPANVVTGQAPFNVILSGANSVRRPSLVPGAPVWITDPNVAGGKRINKAAFSVPAGPVQGNLGRNALKGFGATQVRFDPAAAVQTSGAPFTSGANGFLQHLQPPQLRAPDQLHDVSSIRPGDPDVGVVARQRRPEYRSQSAVSNQRATLGPTGSEARILTPKETTRTEFCLVRSRFLFKRLTFGCQSR